jgi:hypothetical protein
LDKRPVVYLTLAETPLFFVYLCSVVTENLYKIFEVLKKHLKLLKTFETFKNF